MKWRTIFTAVSFLWYAGNICAQVENVTGGKPVNPVGIGFFDGDPPTVPYGSVTDGDFLPPWTPWKEGTVWWVLGNCAHPDSGEVCSLEIDLEGEYRIDSFVFQGDSDTYFLQYMDLGGGGWQTAWQVNPHPEDSGYYGAVQTRPDPLDNTVMHVLPEPIITNMLRVIPSPPWWVSEFRGTDELYAVSEVQAFGEPTGPPPPPFVDCLQLTCFETAEKWEAFLTDELGFCYKVELSCDDGVGGGMGLNMHPDGRLEGGYGFFIPGQPIDCGGHIFHLGNSKFIHSCAFDSGEEVGLEVKAAPLRRCAKEVASCQPPPPPPE